MQKGNKNHKLNPTSLHNSQKDGGENTHPTLGPSAPNPGLAVLETKKTGLGGGGVCNRYLQPGKRGQKNTLSGRIGSAVSQFVWVLTLLAVERNSPTRRWKPPCCGWFALNVGAGWKFL